MGILGEYRGGGEWRKRRNVEILEWYGRRTSNFIVT